jgi:hypothetical protein
VAACLPCGAASFSGCGGSVCRAAPAGEPQLLLLLLLLLLYDSTGSNAWHVHTLICGPASTFLHELARMQQHITRQAGAITTWHPHTYVQTHRKALQLAALLHRKAWQALLVPMQL